MNKPCSEEKKVIEGDNLIFCDKDISNTPQPDEKQYSKTELNRINVFKHIEKTQPTSIYKVHKDLEMAYNTVSYIVRDLIFAGIVHENVIINENNTAVKMLTIPKEVEE